MADTSQYFQAPDSPTVYTDYKSYTQNIHGATPIAESANVYKQQPVAADTMGATTAIKVPGVSTDTAQADGTVAGATTASKSIESYLKEITPPETETSKQYSDLLGQINTLLPELANKSSDQLKAEEAQNLPQLKQDLAGLNSQILTRSAEYEKLNTDIEGKAIPMQFITGQQAQVRRQQASEIGLLQARALGLQGQVQMAQETANRAIDLKYGSMEDEINIKMKQLQLIQPILDKEESRYATALSMKYADDQRRLEEEKAKAKEYVSLAFAANVQTQFVNKGGEFFRASDGKPYSSPEEFYKDAGVTSFDQAYSRGLVTDLTAERVADLDFVSQLRAQYPDAGITINDTASSASAKLSRSRIYQDQVRGPVGSTSGTLAGTSIVDPSIDAGVRNLIASRPGDGGYGDAYNAVASKYGTVVANRYDKVFQDVFNSGVSIDAAFNNLKLGSLTTGSGYVDATGKPVTLSAAQQGNIADWTTLSQLASQTLTLGESIGFSGTGGGYQGSIAQFLAKNLGTGSQEEEQLRNLIGNIKASIAKARGGTSFTPNEEKLLESYTPTINDSPLVIQSKLKSLQSFIDTTTNNIYKSAGAVNIGGGTGQTIPRGTDGAAYGYPGYVSDGTQWVAK